MEDLPRTLKGSSEEAQPTGTEKPVPGNRVTPHGRTAYSALRPPVVTVRARWVRSSRASLPAPARRRVSIATHHDPARPVVVSRFYGHTKSDLYERARGLGIRGRASMSKRELARAIAERQSAA